MTPDYEALLQFAISLFNDYEVAMRAVEQHATYSEKDRDDVYREVCVYRAKLRGFTDAWDQQR